MKKKNAKTQLRGIIAIGNFKGGVGKTTTTLNLAMALHLQGYRVLVMDFDYKCNLSSCTDWEPERELAGEPTVFDVLTRGANIPVYLDSKGIYYTPSSISMEDAESKLTSIRNSANVLYRAFRKPIDDHTGEGLAEWESSFDYIFMDTSGNPGNVTDNVHVAATALIIPTSLETFAIDGLDKYLPYVNDVQEKDNDKLEVLGAVITMRQKNLRGAKKREEYLREKFGHQIFQTSITRRAVVSDSAEDYVSIYDYHRRTPATEEFTMLANELQKKLKGVLVQL